MLSSSIRKRMQPSSPDPQTSHIGTGSLARRGRAPPPLSSVSSKKSFTSLWQKREASRSRSLAKESPNEHRQSDQTSSHGQDEESQPASSRKAPPTSADASQGSPPRLPKKRARSLSRTRSISGSMLPSKALLGKVASVLGLAGSGMAWAANKLHAQSDNQDEEDEADQADAPEQIPQPSPRKVRFASKGHGPRDLSSLPIDIPKKPIPSLPPLQLPKSNIMENLANGARLDPIPTARPPDTPVLKAQLNDGYFGLLSQNQDLDALPSPINPRKDYANAGENQSLVAATSAQGVQSPELPKPSNGHLEAADPKGKSVSQEHFAARPLSSEDGSVAFPHVDLDLVLKDPYSGSAQRCTSSEPLPLEVETHEDTRQRFRGRSNQKAVDGWSSSESGSTSVESPNEFCRVFLTPSSPQQNMEYSQDHSSPIQGENSSISAVRHTLESISLASPTKLNSTRTSRPEKPGRDCENTAGAVIPWTSCTDSPASPTRSRRRFRFSNTLTQKTADMEPCSATVSSSKPFPANKTPSPVSIPLPLSVPPRRLIGKISPALFVPPTQWSPFNEDGFLYALAVATSHEAGKEEVHRMLSQPAGFAKLWDFLQLPKWSGPDANVPIPASGEICDMIKSAQEACKSPRGPFDQHGWSPFDEILFPGVLVTANNDLGSAAIHRYLSTHGGFSKFWKERRLPDCSAPQDDTRLFDEEECQDMVKQAWEICGQSSDQYGWVPFAETNFASALTGAVSSMGYEQVSSLLLQDGGLAKFWNMTGLPSETAPRQDTRALSAQEMDTMVQKAHRVCVYRRGINDPEANSLFQHALGPVPRPSPASAMTEHCVLDRSSDDWSRRQQQYSGEVSTVDFPLDSGGEDGSHAGHMNESRSYTWCSECRPSGRTDPFTRSGTKTPPLPAGTPSLW